MVESWLRGEKTMPFGPNGEHVTVRMVDGVDLTQNQFVVSNQWTFRAGAVEKRFDVVFLVNGLPLIISEAKTPTRNAVTWFDAAYQIHEIYEKQVPAMFVPNVFSFATEGKMFRNVSIRMPIDIWGPWRTAEKEPEGSLGDVRRTVESILRPEVVLDILQNITVFATDKKHRRIKIICRYQQYFTTNQLVDRVIAGYPKKGLIWHFQGSGKSFLMVFAAQKLRLHPKLKIDKAAIDEAYRQITGRLSEQDRDDLAKRAAKMVVLVKNPERIRAVINHIVTHFQTKIEPNGFKAQVVVFDRECCVNKAVMDELIGSDASAIVMSDAQNDPPEWKKHMRDKDAEEKLLDRFRNPADPLKFVIVTSKLLTGFDAPILQRMYLDKPMKDHNLLQAIFSLMQRS